MTAPLLLALTFANGIGLAMRWPVFAAIVPELVSRPQLPAALALNGVAMNASRIMGPLLAGAIIASAGSAWVFVLNAVLSVLSGLVIMRWKRTHVPSPLGRERLPSAMRVGLQFVRQSPRMRAVLWRISVFFLHATALMALLPLVAKGLEGGGAGTFTLLLASMGAGAIVAACFCPACARPCRAMRWCCAARWCRPPPWRVMAWAPNVYVAVPAMVLAGMAWITTANTLSVSAQLALPNWVRARGMSIYQMSIMGATAAGRGAVGPGGHADRCAPEPGAGRREWRASDGPGAAPGGRPRHRGRPEPLAAPSRHRWPRRRPRPGAWWSPSNTSSTPRAPHEFRAVMQESRRSRLRQGALTGTAARHQPTRRAMWSASWTSRGPSTCAASTA
jgi:hypothetical protein